MENSMSALSKNQNYTIKGSELILADKNVQARVITLAPNESIPWHYHSETTDHYFVLSGTLEIDQRDRNGQLSLNTGERHQLRPGIAHSLANNGAADCQFLLLQGIGKYDWIKADH
jgi:quercetin dioxygenase-like cupin family protein